MNRTAQPLRVEPNFFILQEVRMDENFKYAADVLIAERHGYLR